MYQVSGFELRPFHSMINSALAPCSLLLGALLYPALEPSFSGHMTGTGPLSGTNIPPHLLILERCLLWQTWLSSAFWPVPEDLPSPIWIFPSQHKSAPGLQGDRLFTPCSPSSLGGEAACTGAIGWGATSQGHLRAGAARKGRLFS